MICCIMGDTERHHPHPTTHHQGEKDGYAVSFIRVGFCCQEAISVFSGQLKLTTEKGKVQPKPFLANTEPC